MTADLSAFYFDIRKDALYCDPISSLTRKACLTVLDHLFRCTVTWLAPMLSFTAEEAWLSRYPAAATSVHLELFPGRAGELARRRAGGEMAQGAQRAPRRHRRARDSSGPAKRIGSSLEAAPVVHVADPDLFAALADVDLAEVCITSAATLVEGEGPADAFRLPDVPGVAVEPRLAAGAQMRPLLEDSRPRSAAIRNIRTSRRATLRRCGNGTPAQGGRIEWRAGATCSGARSAGSGLRSRCSPRVADQAVKLWLLFVFDLGARGRCRSTPFVDLVLIWNTGISYGLFQQDEPVRPMGAAGLQGGGGGAAVGLAGACDVAAHRARARPDHRRGGRQRHRPAALTGRSPISCFSTSTRQAGTSAGMCLTLPM